MANQVVDAGQAGLLVRMEHAEEVVGLAEGELGVAQGCHWRQGRAFGGGERTHGLVAVEQSLEVVKMYANGLAVSGCWDEIEPLDDVAFDGMGKVMNGGGAVGKAKVNDGGGAGAIAPVGPEEI